MKLISIIFCLAFTSAWGFRIPSYIWPWAQENRIVGGQTTQINERPYQVSVLRYNQHNCGGVILNKEYVLTAAHCFNDVTHHSEIQVRVGSTNAYHGGIIVDVEDITVHELYNEKFTNYDVAVVKLAYPLRFDKNIKAAVLAEDGYEPEINSKVTVSGWGSLSYLGPYPEELQQVDLQVADHDDCYIAYMAHLDLAESQICATVPGGVKDSCTGDSGGPLTENGVVVGIVSFGVRCAEPDYPGVYSRIGFYRKWIDANSK
ncbi:trypsin alpha-like [Ctenocephalides felis]|uniref:trypsin alpha-like n=1 Tax=Ctenocephalides felis TaxID=7515 RepID=UPI000E6E5483|nr:trypsin alpha-like [Ctenocephalides felis]